jgi:hypothetical protein
VLTSSHVNCQIRNFFNVTIFYCRWKIKRQFDKILNSGVFDVTKSFEEDHTND